MDEDAERDPETPQEIEDRRSTVRELRKRERERRKELEEKAAADPWDYWPETHDDLYNDADYEIPPLWEQLDSKARSARLRMDNLDIKDPLAYTIGKTVLDPHYWSHGDNDDLTQKLDGEDATRVYLYLDLSPLPEYRIASRIGSSDVQEELGIENGVSQSTLNRFPGRMGDRERTYYASETETLVRQWQDTPYEEWVRNPTPETIAPDGEGVPPVQTLVRELRAEAFRISD